MSANPGILKTRTTAPEDGLYYYYQLFAKALNAPEPSSGLLVAFGAFGLLIYHLRGLLPGIARPRAGRHH